jgi:hypothetical protein
MLLGDQHAEVWRQIKEYGKTNFMEWFATGSQTFMAKEVLMHKLQGFLTIVLGSEHALKYTDLPELLQQVWDAGQIGKESPVVTEEELQKRQGGDAQGQAHAEAMQAIQEVEHKAGELIKKAQDQAKEAQRMEQFKRDELAAREADSKRKHELALHDALNKNVDAGHKSHLVEAQIDKLQAETLAALAKANEKPSPELEAKGTQAEEGAPKEEKPDPLAKLAEMHGQTLQGIQDLVKAHLTPKELVVDKATGRKRVQPVEPSQGLNAA